MCLAPNGVDKCYRVLEPGELLGVRERFGIRSRFIYHLSHFMPRKNPLGIIKAFGQLVDRYGYPGQLILSGKGWDEARKRKAARALLRDDRIVITGYVSLEDSIRLLNSADCFLFPSTYEGFGIPNLEAMACGCPVVSSNRHAIPEVVGDAGLLVRNPHDYKEIAKNLDAILSSDVLRQELIAKGLERAKLFDWKKSAQTILNCYKSLVDEARTSK